MRNKNILPLLQSDKKSITPAAIHQQLVIINAEKEIYENITQVLCLSKIKLLTLDMDDKEKSAAALEQSCKLIGDAIRDLRKLAKQIQKL